MTGWRIGYIGAPEWIAKACNKMQGQITSGANCIAQRATIAAVTAPVSAIQYMVDEFAQRRVLIVELLSAIPGFKLNDPKGAFYVFPDVSYYFGKELNGKKIENASDFALYLLEQAHEATVTALAVKGAIITDANKKAFKILDIISSYFFYFINLKIMSVIKT